MHADGRGHHLLAPAGSEGTGRQVQDVAGQPAGGTSPDGRRALTGSPTHRGWVWAQQRLLAGVDGVRTKGASGAGEDVSQGVTSQCETRA